GFVHCQDLAGRHILENLLLPARPEDLDAARATFTPEAEVQPRVAAAEIASGTPDLAQLRAPAARHPHAGAKTEAVALPAARPHRQPVVAVSALVAHQNRLPAAVGDDDVEVPVVIEIPHRRAPADMLDLQRRAARGRDVAEV